MSGSMKAATKLVLLLEGQSYPRKLEACGTAIHVVVDGEPRGSLECCCVNKCCTKAKLEDGQWRNLITSRLIICEEISAEIV